MIGVLKSLLVSSIVVAICTGVMASHGRLLRLFLVEDVQVGAMGRLDGNYKALFFSAVWVLFSLW